MNGSDPNETGFRVGDRIEVYWTEEKKRFSCTIADNSAAHRYISGGRKLSSPKLEINYDDGESRTHSLHNTTVRHVNSVPSLFMLLNDRAYAERFTFEKQVNGDMELPNDDEIYFLLTDIELDIETGRALNKLTIFAISANGTLEARAAQINSMESMDTLNARYWHEPRNEREFNRSPQCALWLLTAKELKWGQYLNLNMFE